MDRNTGTPANGAVNGTGAPVPAPAGLTLMVGLPGSGKSTFAARSGLPVVSTDELRKVLTGRYDDLF